MVCVVAYFGYDKVVMGVYRWMLRKTYANESWQYFQAMKKIQAIDLVKYPEHIFQYIDTFVERTYYVYVRIDGDGKGTKSYALADGLANGASHMLMAQSEQSMSKEIPGPENTRLAAITGFEVLDLASTVTMDFTVLGPQEDQQFTLAHKGLVSMRKIILSINTEAVAQ
jgi:hypothetical protein